MGHLCPSADDTKAAHTQATSELNTAVQKIGTISLTQSANDKACPAIFESTSAMA